MGFKIGSVWNENSVLYKREGWKNTARFAQSEVDPFQSLQTKTPTMEHYKISMEK